MIARPELQIVGGTESKLPDPPYPADFRLKKFTFDLDIARVNRSRTWCRCPVEHRPWLLQIWAQSWLSEPPASWEDDDYVIANAIGMNPETFSALKTILMRGWYLCSDGRLYHPYLVDMIQRIIDAREVYRIANERKKNASKNDDTIELPASNSSVTSGKKQNSPLPYIPSVPFVPSVPLSPDQSHPPANPGISPSYQGDKDKNLMHGAQKNALHAGRKIPELPLIDKDGVFYPQPEDIGLWTETYPAVDVMFELGKMRSWIDANPAKRKTAKGIRKFINGWLGRCQDNGGSHKSATNGNGGPRDKVAAAYERSAAFAEEFKAKLRQQTQTIDGECHEV